MFRLMPDGRTVVVSDGMNLWEFDCRPDIPEDFAVISETWGADVYGFDLADWGPVAPEERPPLAFDIGAHVGITAVRMAFKGANVIAVEPDRENVRRLRSHVADLGVTVLPAALVAHSGKYAAVRGAGTSMATIVKSGDGPLVDGETLDWMVETYGSPQFVKVDIEGDEYQAILAASHETLAECERISMEIHPPSNATITGDMLSHLLVTHRVDIRRNGDAEGMLYATRYGKEW